MSASAASTDERVKAIDAAGFEALFRQAIDPWNYRASRFEAFKRQTLLRACGHGTFGRGLELACAIGATTRALSPQCLRLLAVDSSRTALDEARRGSYARAVVFRQAFLPAETPKGPFDLIVVSELAYYLCKVDLDALIRRLTRALAPGGRIVVLHHIRSFPDAAILPALAQRRLRSALHRTMTKVFDERHARFDVAAYAKARPQRR